MHRIGFIGDFITDTGPSIANRRFVQNLDSKKVLISKHRLKVSRILEFFIFLIRCEQICFCGFSNSYKTFAKICCLLKIEFSYICHGIVKYENQFSENKNARVDVEEVLFKNSKIIFCVSETQRELLRQIYPNINTRCEVIYNSIPLNKYCKRLERRTNIILSTGGGMKQKNNLSVCRAIHILNKNGYNFKYIIVGSSKEELSEIEKYDFVQITGAISHDQVLDYMNNAYLYIQNSYFETFGISVLEALASGCNILITTNMGVREIFKDIREEDIITNNNDISQIAEKIRILQENGNYRRLYESMDMHLLDNQYNSDRLFKFLTET